MKKVVNEIRVVEWRDLAEREEQSIISLDDMRELLLELQELR